MERLRWGVLSTAKIGTQKVIPALQRSSYGRVVALASRTLDAASHCAAALHIDRAYGCYDAVLEDPQVDAVYVPLPHHLHVQWSIKALQAGKHVLCEKPIGLSAAEGQQLVEEGKKHPQLKLMEAFMYRFHPQWQTARQRVANGEIGRLETIHTFFSYFNDSPDDFRNVRHLGGGGLMDIGCYPISLSRWLFGGEPRKVNGSIERDPTFQIDRMTSAEMQFDAGTATFTCGTLMAPYQRVNIFGSRGRIEIEIPFNAPPDRPCRMWHQREASVEEITLDVCDQYALQGDAFARAVLDDTSVPTPIEDAVANMRVIEAVEESAAQGQWVDLARR